jgi:hypothetical protein
MCRTTVTQDAIEISKKITTIMLQGVELKNNSTRRYLPLIAIGLNRVATAHVKQSLFSGHLHGAVVAQIMQRSPVRTLWV